MQTFLPYADFIKSAAVLDNQRLGKQRVEAYQIYNVLIGKSNGWINHPAVKMWRNYEHALIMYTITICNEWVERGYKDTIKNRLPIINECTMPFWIGDEEFHSSHRGNLLRKNPIWYSKFKWSDNPSVSYKWPV